VRTDWTGAEGVEMSMAERQQKASSGFAEDDLMRGL
jgi:hypothetical protein